MVLSFEALSIIVSFVAQAGVVQAANSKLLGGASNEEVAKKYPTLVTPAGWAFAIWGIIYTWEAAAAMYLVFSSAAPSAALSKAAPFLVVANACQLVWALAFCRELLFVSFLFLAGIAVSLVLAMHHLDRSCTAAETALVAFPTSLRAGWVTVAALLNLNLSLVARGTNVRPARQLALALATVYLAVGAAAMATFLALRHASADKTLYAAAVAWALLGVFKELPASKAAPDLSVDGRDALRLTTGAATGLVVALLTVSGVVLGKLRLDGVVKEK